MKVTNKVFLFLFLLINGYFPTVSRAQSEKVWAFGYHAGLDFNTGMPVGIQTDISGFGEGQASICDASGQLLFYTEGTYVWDRNNNLMPNGSDLTGVTSTTTYSPTSSTAQGTLIVPMPGTTDKFYVFSLTSMEQNSTGNAGKLFYSVVDMSLNNGMGDVVPGQKGIMVDSMLSERLAAVVGNHCNIWILVCSATTEKFKAFQITHSGVSLTPVLSNVGIAQEFAGYVTVSPNRQMIAATKCFVFGNSLQAARLFDFDVNTGLVTNPVDLLPGKGGYGVCFSPDNSKLYVNGDFSAIYQFDLSSGNAATIQASQTQVCDASMTGLKLGPDNRIYFHSLAGDGVLGRINYPNLGGAPCQPVQNAVSLFPGTTIISGLPNNVPVFDFDLDTATSAHIRYPACLSENLLLEAVNPYGWDYQWSDGDTGLQHSVNAGGLYLLKYYSEPCTYHVDSFWVMYPSIHSLNSCNGASNGMAWFQQADGDTVHYTIIWTDTAYNVLATGDSLVNMPPGRYILQVSTDSDCSMEKEIIINDNRLLASFNSDTLVCQGVEVAFDNASAEGFDQYEWQFGDGSVSGQDSPEHTYDQPGTYLSMLIAASDNCVDTFSRMIHVDESMSAPFTIRPDSICQGESITFTPQPNEHISSVQWAFGLGLSFSDEHSLPVTHAFEQPGIFPVTFSAGFRVCPDTSFQDTVYVYPMPYVYLGSDTDLCLDGSPLYLENLSENPASDYTRLWNTGDTSETLKVVYPGTYSLTIRAAPLGCSTTESVQVLKDCYIDIPNAFTPNGDGYNDYFFPRQFLSKSVARFSMQIFNRWGQKVFETGNTNGSGWDGRFNNAEQPDGVYVYLIDVTYESGRTEKYQGNVTLIR